MKDLFLTLYLEINNTNFIFFVVDENDKNNSKVSFKVEIPLEGIEQNRVYDIEKSHNIIKENIFLIEQKFNFTFKDVVLILDNFNPKFINLTGFKKLNGSQILRENITYILNTLKAHVDEIELKKKVLHIFNTKFSLDYKKIENLPIGLYGDFYSHELSFVLINKNDEKNLKIIFDKCNLKIKKILIKSFVSGACTSENLVDTDNFLQVKIEKKRSKIFYFENSSLKFEQNFKFGSDIIVKDLSKITSVNFETIKTILEYIDFKKKIINEELIEERFFKNEKYVKIKKKLIYEIALARIMEISELMIFKNINLKHYINPTTFVCLEANDNLQLKNLSEIYENSFSDNGKIKLKIIDPISNYNLINTANKIVHFGWKKEAIPFVQSKKSLIARFFESIFG